VITYNGKTYDTWAAARADVSPSTPTPALFAPEPAPVAIVERTAGRGKALTTKYRPRCLREIAGQSEAVGVLSAFCADPYPTVFLFSGDTGTGKTSACYALAAELGCDIDANPPEFGGVHSIPSGELNVDTVRSVWGGLWQTPFDSARGFKVLIINEIESLNGQVERLFLDRLEDLPPHTVICFTTNNLASLPARFVDRCIGGVLEFRAAADDLAEPARVLARQIWAAEVGGEIPADVLEKVITRATTAGRLSFRRVVQNLTPIIGGKGRP
jgi:replication-associated recombination protein RarA